MWAERYIVPGAEFNKTIGIVGGIGPAATAYAHSRLIGIAQDEHGAWQDYEFPNIVVVNFPLRGMDERGYADDVETKTALESQLALGYAAIKKAGADIAYMACNTLHSYEKVLADAGLDEVNIITEAVAYVKVNYPISAVAVLSSEATRRESLYKTAFQQNGIDFIDVTDKQQHAVNTMILQAMGNKNAGQAKKRLEKLCTTLLDSGAGAVVLGCTELSLLAGQETVVSADVIDAQEIALRELLRRSIV